MTVEACIASTLHATFDQFGISGTNKFETHVTGLVTGVGFTKKMGCTEAAGNGGPLAGMTASCPPVSCSKQAFGREVRCRPIFGECCRHAVAYSLMQESNTLLPDESKSLPVQLFRVASWMIIRHVGVSADNPSRLSFLASRMPKLPTCEAMDALQLKVGCGRRVWAPGGLCVGCRIWPPAATPASVIIPMRLTLL